MYDKLIVWKDGADGQWYSRVTEHDPVDLDTEHILNVETVRSAFCIFFINSATGEHRLLRHHEMEVRDVHKDVAIQTCQSCDGTRKVECDAEVHDCRRCPHPCPNCVIIDTSSDVGTLKRQIEEHPQ